MKLSWKIFCSTFLITTLTFSTGGYFLIGTIFKSTFQRELRAAVEENKMLSSYLWALVPTGAEDQGMELQSVSESVVSAFAKDQLAIRVTTDAQTVVSQSHDIFPLVDPISQRDHALAYRVVKVGDRFFAHAAMWLPAVKGGITLETLHDITTVFVNRQRLFSFFRRLMLSMVAMNGLLVFGITRWTTSPIKRLAKTTREIAKGHYENRVVLGSRDELGLLAADFNKMADSLESKIRDLEATTTSQRDFIGSFAHEVRTPLTSIIGYADMLRSQKMAEEARITAANYVFSEGKRLETLSTKLLDLLVVRNGRVALKPVNLRELLNESASVISPLLDQRSALLISAEDTLIMVDPDLIKTLIVNLVDNARKAVGTCGEIRLIGERRSADEVVFVVSDNGRGIPEKELPRVTEIFYTGQKSRCSRGGVGIGLALCKEIVDLHGGAMQFESQEGIGTSVCVLLRG